MKKKKTEKDKFGLAQRRGGRRGKQKHKWIGLRNSSAYSACSARDEIFGGWGMGKQPQVKLWQKLARRYREIRVAKGIPVSAAVHYGLSVSHYRRLEAGCNHRLLTLAKVAAMLGVTPGELVRVEEKNKRERKAKGFRAEAQGTQR